MKAFVFFFLVLCTGVFDEAYKLRVPAECIKDVTTNTYKYDNQQLQVLQTL